MSSYLDLIPDGGEVNYISILFQPYAAKLFFDLPANEFYNQLIPVDAVNDLLWTDLCKRISDTTNIRRTIPLIEDFLIRKLNFDHAYHLDRIACAINSIYSASKIEVSVLAETSCLTQKQFKRVFNTYVGCNPKEFIRINRFNKALNLLHKGINPGFAQLAHECGYSDQSHFIKDFKSFSGYTPLDFLTPDTSFHYHS